MNGKELNKRLKSTGKTQTNIAELLGMSQQALASILKAEDVKTGTLERLCDVLGVKINFFYEGTEYAVSDKGNGLADVVDKDNMIMLLRGQVMAYEKALGVMGEKKKLNVG